MSVGKLISYSECETGSGASDNGCSVDECINTGSRDHLLIPGGFYTKTEKGEQVFHKYNDYYCGSGLGEDSIADGKDDGSGVISQAPGPVAIRYVDL